MATGPFDDVPFRHLAQPLSRLTEHEQATAEAYALNNYARINAALRGSRPMTSDLAESIATMRSAINKFPLDQDIRVTREISATEFGMHSAAEAAQQTPGRLFTEAGFLSASMSETPPRSTARIEPLDLELLVPAGTPALAIGQLSEYPLERELLVINARQIFIVESHQVATSRWRLYGEVIPE
jgi:ADP-ribosyltransferase exoenzyme